MVNSGFFVLIAIGDVAEAYGVCKIPGMPIHLSYTTITLRRDNMSRRPTDWVSSRAKKNIKAVAVHGQHNLIIDGNPPQAAIFEGETARALIDAGRQEILLGTEDDTPSLLWPWTTK